jgi:hypothetical protein
MFFFIYTYFNIYLDQYIKLVVDFYAFFERHKRPIFPNETWNDYTFRYY